MIAISLTLILILAIHEPAKTVEADRLFTLHSENSVISNETIDSNKAKDSDNARRTLHTDTLSAIPV